jgi:putative DNA primase/helicase
MTWTSKKLKVKHIASCGEKNKVSPIAYTRKHGIPQHGLVVTRAADLTPQKLARVWNGRFFVGKLGIIVAEPGVGKGQVAAFMAAKVSTGGDWPCGEGTARRGAVIYITEEDKAADTILPRLKAAGADLKRVHIIEAVNDHFGRRPFNLVSDLGYLSELLRQVRKPRLVVVDPVNGCLSSTDVCRFNPNSVVQVRALLRRYEDLADEHRVAFVCITHFTKAKSGSALARMIGSFAFGAAGRSVFTVEPKADDPTQRILAPAKNNLGREANPLVFRIEERLTTGKIPAPYAVFASG